MAPKDEEIVMEKSAADGGKADGDPLSSNSDSDVESDDRFAPPTAKSKMSSLDIDDGDDSDDDDDDDFLRNNNLLERTKCCFGLIRCAKVGNMKILFPEYYFSSGWGVVGPNVIGPVIVWLILVVATHGVLGGIEEHNLGIGSAIVAYLFLALSTYRLTDVCYRNPGIVLDQEIPGHEPPERAREYRYCDRCKVWQPPDGVHCPECNVCVEGYDHYCVWMGTTIGKKNYKQFVKFNMTVSRNG